jgi:hypothetical protein
MFHVCGWRQKVSDPGTHGVEGQFTVVLGDENYTDFRVLKVHNGRELERILLGETRPEDEDLGRLADLLTKDIFRGLG